MNRLPSVEEARPAQCPCCGVPSRPVGQRLNVQGHGERKGRQMRGPPEVGAKPVQVLLTLRRYLCRCCKATMTVGPMGLLTRRLFGAAAVGLALCLWGLHKESTTRVYEQVNPWQRPQEMQGWRQLGRWALGIQQGELFRGLCPGSLPLSLRAVAERAAAALGARCSPQLWGQRISQQVFAGAALAV